MAGGFRAWWNGQPSDAPRRARVEHLAEPLSASTREERSTVGYLTATELGFVLACRCRLRAETAPPAWAGSLHPGPRAALLQGLRYLGARRQDRT